MAVKKYKPTSAGLRAGSVVDFAEITTTKPEKSLLLKKDKTNGRNNQGRITVRHRGGGVKRKYRLVDFRRSKDNIKAKVVSIEYDPNRTARIALLSYLDGEKSYILAPVNLKVNDIVQSGDNVEISDGNCLPLKNIPIGTTIHNIELRPKGGGKIARSAGCSAQLMAKDSGYAVVRLASGEQRMIFLECRATIGQIGNLDHWNVNLGKAGRARKLGRRPEVRGSVMNPVDHPHGGGEGKAPIGRPSPCTPWGKPALGFKTRKAKKMSNKHILKSRKK